MLPPLPPTAPVPLPKLSAKPYQILLVLQDLAQSVTGKCLLIPSGGFVPLCHRCCQCPLTFAIPGHLDLLSPSTSTHSLPLCTLQLALRLHGTGWECQTVHICQDQPLACDLWALVHESPNFVGLTLRHVSYCPLEVPSRIKLQLPTVHYWIPSLPISLDSREHLQNKLHSPKCLPTTCNWAQSCQRLGDSVEQSLELSQLGA